MSTCPVKGCNADFETRSQTIRHYKKIHSGNFQYCTLCNKPVCAARYKQHFDKHHPNVWNDEEDDEDDLILKGGNQITEWRFPKSIRKRCPAPNCGMDFGIRSDVRSHFKKRHILDHFYCKGCDKLIFACDQNDVYKHQREAHSNVEKGSSSDKKQMPSTSKV